MFRNALALSAAFLLTACGGGGGGLFANHHQTERFATPAKTGYIRSDGTILSSPLLNIRLGDYGDNRWCMGYYSFSLVGINPDATVTQAWLVVGQEATYNNPYADLGGLVTVDHMNLGAALDMADFNLANHLSAGIATLSIDSVAEQKVIDVTAAVQADLDAARTNSEYRLRFPIAFSNDGQADRTYFNNPADAGGSGIVPRLIVEYVD